MGCVLSVLQKQQTAASVIQQTLCKSYSALLSNLISCQMRSHISHMVTKKQTTKSFKKNKDETCEKNEELVLEVGNIGDMRK